MNDLKIAMRPVHGEIDALWLELRDGDAIMKAKIKRLSVLIVISLLLSLLAAGYDTVILCRSTVDKAAHTNNAAGDVFTFHDIAPAAGVNGSYGCHPLYQSGGSAFSAARWTDSTLLSDPNGNHKRTKPARRFSCNDDDRMRT